MKVKIIGKNVCEIELNNGYYLQSYQTIVAHKNRKGDFIMLYKDWQYSRTTVKHITQWLNTDAKTLKQWIKDGRVIEIKERCEL